MADPFEVALPGLGDKPWNLNPAIEELRVRVGKDEDFRTSVNATDFGMVGDGTTNNSTAFVNAINSTPEGYRLEVPYGTYLFSGVAFVDIVKNIDINFNGSTILNAASGPVIRFTGTFEDWYSATSVTPTTLTPSATGTWISHNTPGVILTVPSSVPWKKGDYIRICSDTPLEGQRIQSNPENLSRYGQTMQVYSVSGDTVTLQGFLREPEKYNLNVRVARWPKKRISLSNLNIDMRDSEFQDETKNYTGLEFRYLVKPYWENVHVLRSHGPGFQVNGCFMASSENTSVAVTRNRLANQATTGFIASFGYGIIDVGSELTYVNNYRAGLVRHAFTDDSARGPANQASPGFYGRTFGAIVSNSSCSGASSAAWDTHSDSDSNSFLNCNAYGSEAGYNIRGIRHTVRGGFGAQLRVRCALH